MERLLCSTFSFRKGIPMTALRQRMLEDMKIRNLACSSSLLLMAEYGKRCLENKVHRDGCLNMLVHLFNEPNDRLPVLAFRAAINDVEP